MTIEGQPHWPAWSVPFLKALIRTAERGVLRPGVAASLVGVSRKAPYWYASAHPEFQAKWSEVSVYVLAIERQRLDRKVSVFEAGSI